MESLDSLHLYRSRITTSIDTFSKSIASWQTRKKLYRKLLDTWQPYGQLRENPVDSLRLEFIEEEIVKQQNKLKTCKDSFKKFEVLEKQLQDLAKTSPVPTMDDSDIAADETFMEIREELDDDDNVISSTVIPQSAKSLHNFGEARSEASTAGKLMPTTEDSGKALATMKQTKGQLQAGFESHSTSTATKDTSEKRNSISNGKVSHAKKELSQETKAHRAEGSFGIRETADGQIEITDDPDGFSIGIMPNGLAEMTSIVGETDWGQDLSDEEQDDVKDNESLALVANEDEDEDEEEDEYGRVKHRGMVPLPGILSRPSSSQEVRDHLVEHNRRNSADQENVPSSSARSKQKKKLVFADKLVQGPSAGSSKSPARPVLKKESAYPITEEFESPSPPSVPTIFEPKQSRFKLQRSSTDTMITSRQHAQPSQAFQEKLQDPVATNIVERETPKTRSEDTADDLNKSQMSNKDLGAATIHTESTDESNRLYPNKINLAGFDLAPEDGLTKAPLSIPKLSDEEMAAIRRKREAMGKKHRRRKSADPNYPIRSGSWDESQPLQKPQRRPSTGEVDAPSESMKTARLDRAVEILKAQEDIAWANAPITPEEVTPESNSATQKDPLAEAGQKENLEKAEEKSAGNLTSGSSKKHNSTSNSSHMQNDTRNSAVASTNQNETSTPKVDGSAGSQSGIISPVPRKPPTPERSSSFTNIPSPLRQEIQPASTSKEVQFTSDIIKRLEPLAESDAEPTVVARERKLPHRQPVRQSSIDPQIISPTPHSPPPEQRHPGPLGTEEEGSVSHYMVRATSKSPPPHIAIHDLIGDTPEAVRLAMKEEVLTPTPGTTVDGSGKYEEEINPMDMPTKSKATGKSSKTTNSTNGIVEHVYEQPAESTTEDISEEEIDDELHKKEIAQEYHRLRARMIGREGGYVKEEEGEIVPLDTPENEPVEKMSRFKAARLGQKRT